MNYYEAVLRGEIQPEELPPLPEDVWIEILPNGFTAIVKPLADREVLAALLVCDSGSATEGQWLGTGISHLVEHMLFKGTAKRPTGTIEEEVQALGGYINAYTSFEEIAITLDLPAEHWQQGLDILYDLSHQATFPEEELWKEMDVIRREMDMEKDDPAAWSFRRLRELVYRYSPYRHPIIGHRSLFDRLKRNDLLQYYKERFVPNRLTLVIAGNVPADRAIEQIKGFWEALPVGRQDPWEIPQDPPPIAPSQWADTGPFELAWLHYAWRTPARHCEDALLLSILAGLFGAGKSSRLYRKLRLEHGLVHSVDCWIADARSERLFGITIVAHPNKLQLAEQLMREELLRIQSEPPSQDECQKLLNQFYCACMRAFETVQGHAGVLASDWLSARDLLFTAREIGLARRVTPEQLSQAASKHLRFDRSFRYVLLPHQTVPKKPRAVGQAMAKICVQRTNLFGQATLLTRPDPSVPLLHFRLTWLGGTIFESEENCGITSLFAGLWTRGTRLLTDQQIAEAVEALGATIQATSHAQTFALAGSCLPTSWPKLSEILLQIIHEPSFPDPLLAQEKELRIQQIEAEKDDILAYGQRTILQHLFYGKGFGLPPRGTPKSIQSITRQDLLEFHRRYARPEQAVISLFGAQLPPEQLSKFIEDLRSGYDLPRPMVPKPAPVQSFDRPIFEALNKAQALLLVAFPGTTVFSEDSYPLSVLIHACQGMGSRIFKAIREEHGLAYYASATIQNGLVPGYILFYVGTSPENLPRVYEELFSEIRSLAHDGLSPNELQRTKQKLVGNQKLSLQAPAELAAAMSCLELYGLGYQAVEIALQKMLAVTAEQVLEVGARYLGPEQAVALIVGPTELETQIQTLPSPKELLRC